MCQYFSDFIWIGVKNEIYNEISLALRQSFDPNEWATSKLGHKSESMYYVGSQTIFFLDSSRICSCKF